MLTALTTQDKHYLCCQRVARLQVSLAQGVDLGVSGKVSSNLSANIAE